MEASISALADGSAGFEPPAPPTAESDLGHRAQRFHGDDDTDDNTHTHQSSDRQQRGSSVMDGHREGRDEDMSTGGGRSSNHRIGESSQDAGETGGEEGCNDSRDDFGEPGNFLTEGNVISPTGDNHPGDHHRSTEDHAVASTAAVGIGRDMASADSPKVPGNGYCDRGGTGVLRGVSAAMASGALPVAARPSPNTSSSAADQDRPSIGGRRAAFPNEAETVDRLPHVASEDNGRLDSAGFYETTPTGRGEGRENDFAQDSSSGRNDPGAGYNDQATAGNWRQDERGEQARRHIDQALRQRTLRRRNRCAALSNDYVAG